MNSQGASALVQILSNADIFLLIFARIIGLITIAPVLGGKSIPLITRIGFSLAIACIIYSSGNITDISYNDSVIGYAILVAKEFIVGFSIGFVVYFVMNIAYLAGHLTDQQIGFSMVSVYDPITQTQVPIVGNLYYFAFCALLIIFNGHHMIISSLFYSYKALPMGSAHIIGNEGLFKIMFNLLVTFFRLGFTIALPIIGIIFIMDLALGILVKTVPKINVFIVGIPAKIFVGLFGVWLILPMFGGVYNMLYEEISRAVLSVIKVMMP